MKIALITGSNGLIGSESTKFFSKKFDLIVGIDNNMRMNFFGRIASTNWLKNELIKKIDNYHHQDINIFNKQKVFNLFSKYSNDIKLIIHTAAQPSHDWAASNPFLDYKVNSYGTLILLEAMRKYCKHSTFIFTSTNKVYGDTPNQFKFKELKHRYEILDDKFKNGFDEKLTVDQSTHSLFGSSKLSADIYVQEYGKYFNLKTGIFRGGCLTGPQHSGAQLHGFLSYLIKCNLLKKKYSIFGYKGKQVRDNIHCSDLITMFYEFYKKPKMGEVYNCGGGRKNNCSVLEAIKIIEDLTSIKMNYEILSKNRVGDHQWYITDYTKFKKDFPSWSQKYSLKDTINEMVNNAHL